MSEHKQKNENWKQKNSVETLSQQTSRDETGKISIFTIAEEAWEDVKHSQKFTL